MSRKAKISGSQKVAAIEKYLSGEDSLNHIAVLLGISYTSVKQWLQTYQSLGPNGLNNSSRNIAYSPEIRAAAVEEYLAGGGSHMDICKRYGIKSTSRLRNWILKYNGHEKLRASRTGGTSIVTNGRATTYDEKIEIVSFCIEHQHDYAQTAEKFQVSYQQVYSWTNKYLKSGVEALQDKRGKRKSVDEMSEVEKLRAQNKLLQAENKRKQMEIDFLKKLEEIKRRRF